MSKESSTSGGIGFVGLLTIVFITLKLTKAIAWSWWWVLSALWIPIAVGLLISLLAIIYSWYQTKQARKRWRK